MFIKMKKVALVIDWASLSYHQLWALDSKKKSATQILIDSKEEELNEWRHAMLYSTLEFIKMVNPLDVYWVSVPSPVWYIINFLLIKSIPKQLEPSPPDVGILDVQGILIKVVDGLIVISNLIYLLSVW